MNKIDVDSLLDSLDDESNETLLNLSTKKIHEMNLLLLNELELTKEETDEILEKLKGYKFVDELKDLKSGTFLRWIPLDATEAKLTRGAFFCDVNITDEGINVLMKNHFHRHFTIKFDDHMIFQKLTNQELILLSALDFLEKK
jgi:hypothetical protein